MTTPHTSTFLRGALMVDAIVTGTTAVALIAGSGVLQHLLGLPAALLWGAGLSLVPFTAFLVYLLRGERISRGAAWFVVACNALWAIDSVALLLTDWVDPTLIGQVFVVFQAIVVAAFAELQYMALRRLAPAA